MCMRRLFILENFWNFFFSKNCLFYIHMIELRWSLNLNNTMLHLGIYAARGQAPHHQHWVSWNISQYLSKNIFISGGAAGMGDNKSHLILKIVLFQAWFRSQIIIYTISDKVRKFQLIEFFHPSRASQCPK